MNKTISASAKKILLASLLAIGAVSYASANECEDTGSNCPDVNAKAASNMQFGYVPVVGKKGQKYNASSAKKLNNPNVNAKMSSQNQFPNQTKLVGKKGQKYNVSGAVKQNNPNVNARMASSSMFPGMEDNFGNRQPNNTNTIEHETAQGALDASGVQ